MHSSSRWTLVKRRVPEPLVERLHYGHLWLKDMISLLLGRREIFVPPERMIFVGEGDFKTIGREFLRYFVEFGGLKPEDRVLDVGSGIGRMAVPLLTYLSAEGSYEGFDIVRSGVRWCRKRITPVYPNFRFQFINIYNKRYNPRSRFQAADFRFPFPDGEFDFVFLASIFTHLLPRDMEHYLAEVSRVLKKCGRCLITFFLLNEESRGLMTGTHSELNFPHERGRHWILDEKTPERAVAYNEEYVRGLYREDLLRILEPVRWGTWCGRSNGLSFQDIVIAEKS